MMHLQDLITPAMAKYSSNVCVKFYDSEIGKNNLAMTFEDVAEFSSGLVRYLRDIVSKGSTCCLHFDQNSSEIVFYVSCVVALLKMDCNFYFIENCEEIPAEMKRVKSTFILSGTKLSTKDLLPHLKTFEFKSKAIHFYKCSTSVGNAALSDHVLAYIIRTSGSTGKKKYVQVTHSSIVPNIMDIKNEFMAGPTDQILMASSPTFDPSIIDLFVSISSGASLLMVPAKAKMKKKLFTDIFIDNKVTILQCTPCLLNGMGGHFISRPKTCLRILALGGEKLSEETIQVAKNLMNNGVAVYHLYGVTEMSVWQSMFKVQQPQELEDLPVYQKGNNILSQTEVLLQNGEILVNSSERACFVNFNHKIKKYWCVGTGDRGERRGDAIYFLGRTNNVVKIMGKKVCLDKIERQLEKCFGTSVYCIFDEFIKGVVAAVAEGVDCKLEIQQYFRLAESCLDTHEVPFKFINITKVPTTLHGKTDKEELLKWARAEKDKAEEQQPEKMLETLWERILGKIPKANDDFISSGGDSFQAVALANQLQDSISGQLSPRFIETLINCEYSHVVHLISTGYVSQHLAPQDSLVRKVVIVDLEGSLKPTKRLKHDPILRSKGRQLNRPNMSPEANKKVHLSLDPLWKVDFSKCIDSSPLYIKTSSMHLAVVGSHSGRVGVVDIDSGQTVWMITLPDRVESSPVCDDEGGLIYIGCYDGYLYCITVHTGEIVWQFRSQGHVKGSALVIKDTAYFGSYDHHLYKLSSSSGGQLVWKVAPGKGSILATPLQVPLGVLVATLDGVLATVDFDGVTLWSECLGFPVFSSPLLMEDESCVLVGSVDNAVRCLSTRDGSVLWKLRTEGPVFSSPVSYGASKYIFGCHDNCVYCVDGGGGVLWKRDVGEKVCSSVDYTEEGVIVVAVTNGTILLLSREGEIISEIKLPGEVFSSPVLLEDKVIVGCRDNFLYCLPVGENKEL